jgi:hypothetical protein
LPIGAADTVGKPRAREFLRQRAWTSRPPVREPSKEEVSVSFVYAAAATRNTLRVCLSVYGSGAEADGGGGAATLFQGQRGGRPGNSRVRPRGFLRQRTRNTRPPIREPSRQRLPSFTIAERLLREFPPCGGGATAKNVEGLAFGVYCTGTGKPEQRRSATGISYESSAHSGAASAALQQADPHSDADSIRRNASDIASARLLRWPRSSPFLELHISHSQRMTSGMKS